jgi:myo-inositol-1(or 4)-monophosphatase
MTVMATLPITNLPDDVTLQAAEELSVRAAMAAGQFISKRFGGPMEIMQKAERDGIDIVTDVDKASQKLIVGIIEERFPEHQILGEEDPPDEEPAAKEFMWAVDPIDGTKNFVNGSTIHAVSIALLHRGVPVVGAIWTPWPGDRGYALIHARAENGAWLNDERVSITKAAGDGVPEAGRLAAVPGDLRGAFEIKKPLQGNLGEIRMTGSTCYELMMVATGSMQYALNGYSSVWDYAAGLIIIREAGGISLIPTRDGWREISGWGEMFTADIETSKRMRSWKGTVLSSTPETAAFVSMNLVSKRTGLLKRAWRSVNG